MDQGSIVIGDLAMLAKDELKTPFQNVVKAIIRSSQEIEDISKNSLKRLEDKVVNNSTILIQSQFQVVSIVPSNS